KGRIIIRRVADGSEVLDLSKIDPETAMGIMTFSLDSRFLAAVYNPGLRFKIWDLTAKKVIFTAPQGRRLVHTIFSPDSHWVVLTVDGELIVLDLSTASVKLRWRLSQPTEFAFGFDAAGRRFASLDKSRGFVQFWDPESGQLLQSISTGHAVGEIAWSPDG